MSEWNQSGDEQVKLADVARANDNRVVRLESGSSEHQAVLPA